MKTKIVHLVITALLLGFNAFAMASPSRVSSDALAEEEWAYSLGIQAYIFGLPLTIFEREYALRTKPEVIKKIEKKCPCALMNQVGHHGELATADDVMPYTPNNDTVYSGLLLEFEKEPVILSVPDIDDRYWSVQVADPYTENVFYLGSRATEGKGGDHAFVAKDWQGTLPEGVIAHRMEYPAAMAAIRIAVQPENSADLAEVHQLQQKFVTTSLNNFGKPGGFGQASLPEGIDIRPNHQGELAFYETVAELMIRFPPSEKHLAMVNSFAKIGLVPGKRFDTESLSPEIIKGLVRAAENGPEIMKWKVKYRGTPYPTRWNNLRPGDYGFDYFDRAAGALEGLFVHDRQEAVYFSTYESGDGELLEGKQRYLLHFDASEIPPTQHNGFWSLTMYGPHFQLVKNAINRFSIGDRTENLAYNEDGSLDIYIQSDPPKGRESNWLPAPVEGLFRINYRIYLPEAIARNPATLEKFLPPIVRAE